MRDLIVRVYIGKHAIEEIVVPILDDNATPQELDNFAFEVFNDAVRFDWEVEENV